MNAHLRQAALGCLVFHLHIALGQASPPVDASFARSLTPAELKRVYLACDFEATRSRLSPSDVMHCSILSEELKNRVFGGDLDRLLVWWRTQRLQQEDGVGAES